jgi:hypothetical protein
MIGHAQKLTEPRDRIIQRKFDTNQSKFLLLAKVELQKYLNMSSPMHMTSSSVHGIALHERVD